jgi:hypothetical protein
MEPRRHRFAVFSTGHAGSTWLLHLFRDAAGIVTFHEPLRHTVSSRALQAEMADLESREKWIQPYRDWLRHRGEEHDVFGEVHTGHWEVWSTMKELAPANRCLVTRHPVQVVHSISRSIRASGERGPLPRYRERIPEDVRLCSTDEEIFADACLYCSAEAELLDALAPMPKYRLEDLTTRPALLQSFIRDRTGAETSLDACAAFARDVKNRKVQGDRSPENLFWNAWSDSERELFQRLGSVALSAFGYSLPPAASAPAAHEPPARAVDGLRKELGSLRSAWVFYSNPRPRVVLVYGAGARALVAAKLVGHHTPVLVRSRSVELATEPTGFDVVSVEESPLVKAGGIFVVHPEADRSDVRRLQELNPNAEVVIAEPPSASEHYANPEPSRHDRGTTIVRRYGPLRIGASVNDSWRIARLQAAHDLLLVQIADERGRTIGIQLKPGPLGQFRPPARVGDGYVEYRTTETPYEQFGTALDRLASELARSLGGHSVAEAMERWYRAAVLASLERE